MVAGSNQWMVDLLEYLIMKYSTDFSSIFVIVLYPYKSILCETFLCCHRNVKMMERRKSLNFKSDVTKTALAVSFF